MRSINVRDLGGLPARGGRQTAFNVLLRCGGARAPVPLPAVHAARSTGGAYLVDLREPAEVDQHAFTVPGLTVHRFSVHSPAEWIDRTRDDLDEIVTRYLSMLPDAYKVAGHIVRLIAEDAAPVVTTCRLGKDKTGVVVMSLLCLLGVTDRWILRDFGATGRWFQSHPHWVRQYAHSRGEDPAQVFQRLVLPPAVPAQTLTFMHANAAKLRSCAAIDTRSLNRARRRILQWRNPL